MDNEEFKILYDGQLRIEDRLNSIDTTLAGQHAQLTEHIRRTNLLENDLKPIKRHVIIIQGIGGFVAFLATIGGLLKLLGVLL